MRKMITVLAVSLLLLFLIGCYDVANDAASNAASKVNVKVQDFGNGVLYFPYSGEDFGRAFSAWRATHPKWIIIAVAPDRAAGFYVIANPDL